LVVVIISLKEKGMKMGVVKETVKKTIEAEEIADIICDVCGKSCKKHPKADFEFATLNSTWGYFSKKDMERHQIIFCEDCYDEFLEERGIKPFITDYAPGIKLPEFPV
jgi:hypothetical protein